MAHSLPEIEKDALRLSPEDRARLAVRLLSSLAWCGKTPSESFDGAQDERRNFEIIEDFPFMLRRSKHSVPFFSNLLERIG